MDRLLKQGFDTVTHALVVRDMLRWDEEESSEPGLGLCRTLIFVVVVWAIHAVGNIVSAWQRERYGEGGGGGASLEIK